MVEEIYLRLQAVLLKCCSQHFYEIRLLSPRDIRRRTVRFIQRFILGRHGINIYSVVFHALNKLHEIIGIRLIIIRIDMSIGP